MHSSTGTRATPDDEWVIGAPDLVVEVLSPSNTAIEMQDREDVCFTNGALQFWTVSIERRSVTVTTSQGRTGMCHPGNEIGLAAFGGGKQPVSGLFEA